jgi:sugar O-acyltransferase (sialic acid O-acetyltransferase NeuD family)
MRRLLLVAAGGLTREVLQVLWLTGEHQHVRVLDDDADRWGEELAGRPIVGGLDLVTEYDDHRVVLCAGRGRTRRALAARLSALGVYRARYASVVHPRVHVPPGSRVGRGSVLLEGVVMTTDVQVGAHVVVMPHVTLTHDDVVEDFATLCAGVSLGGHVHVGEGAYLGMNSSVREHLRVGRDAVLGMGAALVAPLPPGETWVGVPAAARLAEVAEW